MKNRKKIKNKLMNNEHNEEYIDSSSKIIKKYCFIVVQLNFLTLE